MPQDGFRRPRWHSHAQLYEREGIRQVSGVKKSCSSLTSLVMRAIRDVPCTVRKWKEFSCFCVSKGGSPFLRPGDDTTRPSPDSSRLEQFTI